MINMYIAVILVILVILNTNAQRKICPMNIVRPCYCNVDRFNALNLVCASQGSFKNFLDAAPPAPKLIFDQMIVTNFHIPRLYAYALGGYASKSLSLRNNTMSDVDKLAFDGSDLIFTLNELEISHNFLDHTPDLIRLRNLTFLNLANNQIQKLQANFFRHFESRNKLLRLDYSGNFLRFIDENAFADLENLRDLNLDKNFLTEVPGQALLKLSRLVGLSLSVNQIRSLSSKNLIFSSLKSLSLAANQIRSIEPDALRHVQNLVYLYLGGNKIEYLPTDMFRYTPNLQIVDLSQNPITTLSTNLFKLTPNLIKVDFTHCFIDNIEPGALQAIPRVEVVNLQKNKLTKINLTTFQGLSNVYSIDLKANLIDTIETHAFANLPFLKYLDLSSNRLSYLDPYMFVNTFNQTEPPTATALYLYDNPWNCGPTMEIFRQWLKQHWDLLLDSPENRPAVCSSPEKMSGVRLKSSSSFINPEVPVESSTEKYREGQVKKSSVSLAAFILGIILTILIVALILLLIARYYVSKRRRDAKLSDRSYRMGEVTGRYNSRHDEMSGVSNGSAFPASVNIAQQHDDENDNQQRRYVLNRPWYWWF